MSPKDQMCALIEWISQDVTDSGSAPEIIVGVKPVSYTHLRRFAGHDLTDKLLLILHQPPVIGIEGCLLYTSRCV